jgi:hypothetical protein
VPAPKSGRLRRWCERCRASKEDARAQRRLHGTDRPCRKCGTNVPERAGKPGITVCDRCRADPRKARRAHEERRRLRKYGLTAEEYERLLASQNGRCRGCGTTDPGRKGWHIDHCHATGRVRCLLCNRCNTVLGMCGEDPAILGELTKLAAEFNQLRLAI